MRQPAILHSIVLACFAAISVEFNLAADSALAGQDERTAVSKARAGNWPGWRGGDGSGVSDERDLPTQWNETSNVIWKTPVHGSGNSSPVVWDDRIFLTTAENGGKRRAVLCFDRATGKQLWRTDCPGDATEETHRLNGYASSTPATDGSRVYAFFGSAGAMAVDFEGRLAWHRDLGPFTCEYGIAGSPTLHGNLLFLNCDQGTDTEAAGSFIIALDKNTGQTVWRTERPGQSHSWSTPVLVPVEGTDRLELVLSGDKRVWAYDPGTGEPLWSCEGTKSWVTPTAVSGQGLLYVVSGETSGGPVMAIRPGGKGDVASTHVAWQSRRGGASVPSPVFYKGRLYVVNDGGILTFFDGTTGKTVLQGRLQGSKFSSSLVAADDKLYITNEDGDTFVLAADSKLKILSKNPLGEPCVATPALSQGQIFIRTKQHLWCIGKS